jgi:hypothetical protein
MFALILEPDVRWDEHLTHAFHRIAGLPEDRLPIEEIGRLAIQVAQQAGKQAHHRDRSCIIGKFVANPKYMVAQSLQQIYSHDWLLQYRVAALTKGG